MISASTSPGIWKFGLGSVGFGESEVLSAGASVMAYPVPEFHIPRAGRPDDFFLYDMPDRIDDPDQLAPGDVPVQQLQVAGAGAQ